MESQRLLTAALATALSAALAAATMLCGLARAEEPWSADARHPVLEDPAPARFVPAAPAPAHSFWLAYQVWSRLLTRIDGPRCTHRPTCSAYAAEAVRRFGLVRGSLLAISRLLRGARSSALRLLPFEDGRYRDTIQDGTFWWQAP